LTCARRDRIVIEGAYDYIVVGAGASGAIIAGELSKTGAKAPYTLPVE
jgi:L-2-hydroxyglutarate oxidase LhgO